MHRMVVEYGNHQKEVIPIKHHFVLGSKTRVIDLPGGKRVIKAITVWCDSKNRAKMHLFGKY